MSGILTALLTSTLGIFVYIGFFSLQRKRPQFKSGIRKLIHHGVVMSFIWAILLPLFFLLSNRLAMTGLDLLSAGAKIADVCLAIYGIAVLGICFFVYTMVYYVVDRSVSSRMMIEIERSPQKRMNFDQIKAIYNIDKKYQDELDGMLQGGFLRSDGQRYRCTFKGMALARFAAFMKWSLKLGPGG